MYPHAFPRPQARIFSSISSLPCRPDSFRTASPCCAWRALPPTLSVNPRLFTQSRQLESSPRSRDFSSGFTGSYDPLEEGQGRGPMFSKASVGVPAFYPRDLKKRVDEYVVGQDRAKKTISSVVFNHYQRLRRRQYHEELDRKRHERMMRQAFARDRDRDREREFDRARSSREWDPHPAQDDYPGHHESTYHLDQQHQPWNYDAEQKPKEFYIPEDTSQPRHVKIDKSNLLLIGPTGVGKTYILETLSKKINVPFTISDCNSFTQAGYIGQDVESCIERLLIEANYDVKAAEHGIVVLDEFDKIARRETPNGRDVGGEGVQQALLKMVEGTKVTVNVKDGRAPGNSPRSASPITTNYTGSGSSTSSGPQSPPPPGPPSSGKVDQYTVDTSNILFVMCGAFVGLDKVILNRVAKPSMGFGSDLRALDSESKQPELPASLFAHLPHLPNQPIFRKEAGSTGAQESGAAADDNKTPKGLTALDLTTPEDLQGFGFIPELIGRVHSIVALAPLSALELERILTEPRDSLVAQYTALFATFPSRLRFTGRAIAAVAERARRSRTGARALRSELERVLAEPTFDAPVPYVLVTEAAVRGEEPVCYWGKDGRLEMERRIAEEDGLGDAAPAEPYGGGVAESSGA